MSGFFSPVRPLLIGWLLSFVAFGVLATVLVGQFALAASMPLEEALRIAARDWLPWALVTPLLFRLVSRLPIERQHLKLAIPVHLLSALVVIALANWWAETILPPRFGRGGRPPAEAKGPRPPRVEGAGVPQQRVRGERRPPPSRTPFRVLFLVGFRLPIYLAVVSIAHALLFYRRAQARERRSLELEASLAKARLDALAMQLQPHFLFNSLNAIAALVHKDPEAADEMLGALSDFLRMTLESSGEPELPLRRELEFIERYLAIEKVRFGDRLRFTIDVEPGTLEARVPALVLQPLVENAVRHGIEARPGEGLITISAARSDSRLLLKVTDNGAGLRNAPGSGGGIGLTNTRSRLRELYGDAATLELRNEGGVSVLLSLPFRAA